MGYWDFTLPEILDSQFFFKEFETCKGNVFCINEYTYHL